MRALTCMLMIMLLICPLMAVGQVHGPSSPPVAGGRPTTSAITEPVSFTFGQPSILNTGHGSTAVSIEGTRALHHPGLPRVPVQIYTMELPAGSMVTKVEAFYEMPEVVPLEAPIEMAPPMNPIGPDGPLESALEMYYDGDTFPADWYAYDIGRGLNNEGAPAIFVNIFAYPVRVQGLGHEQRIWSTTGLEVKIGYTPPDHELNRAILYDMLLIGPNQFEDELQVLADHKDATGLKCKVATLPDIYGGVHFPAQGRDNPERIKYFIKDALDNWGIQYVLLGGDIDKVPSRITKVVDGYDDDAAMHLDGQWTVSDAYFGDIYNGSNQFSSWDENGNGTFGEWLGGRNGTAADDPDFYLDVYVGRLPAGTDAEMSTMVDKVVQYENNTDWDWFFKSTIAALDIHYPPKDPADIDEGELSGDIIAADLVAKGYTVQKLYEAYGTLSSGAINSAINGGVGLIDMLGHGTFTAWGSNQQLYYQNSHISDLNNGVKLPVGHQASCLTAAFDNEQPTFYPGPENKDSMGEEFVKRDGGGHIANYGYSRVAYGGAGYDHPNQTSGFMNTALFNRLAEGPTTPGKALNDARNDCLANLGVSFVGDFKHMSFFILFGDPSVALGGIGLSVNADSQSVEAMPGNQVNVDLTVENVGPYDTTATLSLSSPGQQWASSIDKSTMSLTTGQQRTVTLSVTPGTSMVAGDMGRFTVSALSEASGRRAVSTVEVVVGRVEGIEVSVTDDRVSARPGQDAMFEAVITNTGNGDDKVLTTSLNAPDGWVVEAEHTELSLAPLGTNATNVTVHLPEQVMPGPYPFDLTVMNLAGSSQVQVQVTVDVIAVKGLVVANVTFDPTPVAPGEMATLSALVHNQGNEGTTVSIDVTVPAKGCSATVDRPTFPLGPYESASFDVNVTADDDASPGAYPFTIDIISSPIMMTVGSYNLTVKEVWAMSLWTDGPTTLTDGEEAVIDLWTSNLGNVAEQVELTILDGPEDWTMGFDTLSFPVPAFGDHSIELTVQVPQGTPPGQYIITVLAGTDRGNEYEHDVGILVSSRPDAMVTLAKDTMSGDPGETLTNTVKVENKGNVELTVTLTSTSAQGLKVAVQAGTAVVGPGRAVDVDLKLLISSDAMAGDMTYEVHAAWCNCTGPSLNGTVTVNLIRAIDMDLRPGTSNVRTIVLTNNGNGPEVLAVTVSGLHSKWVQVSEKAIPIGPGEVKELTVTFRPPANADVGTYKVKVSVGTDGTELAKETVSFKVVASEDPMASFLGPGAVGAWVLGIALAVLVVFYLTMRLGSGRSPSKQGPEDGEDEDGGS